MTLILFFALMTIVGACLSFWGIFSTPFDNEMLLGGVILLSIGFVALIIFLILSTIIIKKQEKLNYGKIRG